MVPRFGELAALQTDGERLLVAQNGLFLEIRRPWLRIVRKVGGFEVATAIPYGRVDPATELNCGRVPPELVGEFADMARAAMPNETGAWIVWHPDSRAFRIVPLVALSHSAGHLVYERPVLEDGEVMVMDCHSHGASEAFFSRTDNSDDCHDTKLAFVLGNCGSAHPSIALRLCAKGIFERMSDIPVSWRQAVAAKEVA
jgi:PRTRC genetic system protein A